MDEEHRDARNKAEEDLRKWQKIEDGDEDLTDYDITEKDMYRKKK